MLLSLLYFAVRRLLRLLTVRDRDNEGHGYQCTAGECNNARKARHTEPMGLKSP